MKTSNITIRVLEPAQGYLLYNGSTLSEKVFLGSEADPGDWQEVTIAKAEEIRAAQEREGAATDEH